MCQGRADGFLWLPMCTCMIRKGGMHCVNHNEPPVFLSAIQFFLSSQLFAATLASLPITNVGGDYVLHTWLQELAWTEVGKEFVCVTENTMQPDHPTRLHKQLHAGGSG